MINNPNLLYKNARQETNPCFLPKKIAEQDKKKVNDNENVILKCRCFLKTQ